MAVSNTIHALLAVTRKTVDESVSIRSMDVFGLRWRRRAVGTFTGVVMRHRECLPHVVGVAIAFVADGFFDFGYVDETKIPRRSDPAAMPSVMWFQATGAACVTLSNVDIWQQKYPQ